MAKHLATVPANEADVAALKGPPGSCSPFILRSCGRIQGTTLADAKAAKGSGRFRLVAAGAAVLVIGSYNLAANNVDGIIALRAKKRLSSGV